MDGEFLTIPLFYVWIISSVLNEKVDKFLDLVVIV
jgi:hypothetical protein